MLKIVVLGTDNSGLAALSRIIAERAMKSAIVGTDWSLVPPSAIEVELNHQDYGASIPSELFRGERQSYAEFKTAARRKRIVSDSKARHAAKEARRMKRFK